MNFEDLMDETDGRLTRLVIHHPELKLPVMKVQKHVQFALNNPERVDQERLLRKLRQVLGTAMVLHPHPFAEHFHPIVSRIDEFCGKAAS